MWQRYRKMKDQNPWPALAVKQDFAEGRKIKPLVKKCKCLTWETC